MPAWIAVPLIPHFGAPLGVADTVDRRVEKRAERRTELLKLVGEIMQNVRE